MKGDESINVLFVFLMFIIGIPITTFLHEVGHALGLIFSTKNKEATVHLGGQNYSDKETFRVGRIHFYLKWGYSGCCSYLSNSGEFTKRQWIIFMLGGPLISLFFGLLLIVALYLYTPAGIVKGVIWWFIIANFSQFLLTIIPIRYPAWYGAYAGMPSDGYQIVEELKVK